MKKNLLMFTVLVCLPGSQFLRAADWERDITQSANQRAAANILIYRRAYETQDPEYCKAAENAYNCRGIQGFTEKSADGWMLQVAMQSCLEEDMKFAIELQRDQGSNTKELTAQEFSEIFRKHYEEKILPLKEIERIAAEKKALAFATREERQNKILEITRKARKQIAMDDHKYMEREQAMSSGPGCAIC